VAELRAIYLESSMSSSKEKEDGTTVETVVSAQQPKNPTEVFVKTDLQTKPKLWAVGGGKGGVGKSLISANFALTLATRGKKVLAIDLDLGGANLHTCLGVEPPKLGIGDWLTGRNATLEELKTMTPNSQLAIISGSSDPIHITQFAMKKKKELIQELRKLPYDDIVIDLGAGTQDFTIEMFNSADQGILSILPEPTSVENAYRFIKAVFYDRLRNSEVPSGIKEVIEAAMDHKNILGIRTPADLFAIVERLDPIAAEDLHEVASTLKPSIVINQVRSQVDIDVGRAICSVCRRFFGIEVKYAGYIDYDNSVWKAVRSKKAVIQEFPHSVLANRMEHLTKALLGEEKGLFP
jgi:flagellar biosynthesis protein FlhG